MDRIESVDSKGRKIEIRDGIMYCFKNGKWVQIDPLPKEEETDEQPKNE